MNYQNKWFIVTGAYRGIGKSIAIYFASLGANIILTYHHHEKETNELKDNLIKKYNNKVESLYLDLKDENSIQKLFHYFSDNKLDIFCLINNASISLDNYYLDKEKKEFMDVLEVNCVGTFLMMKYFDKTFKNRVVVNISSTDGIDTGSIYSVDYNVSKSCINVMSKTIAMESPNTIISICPNWVNTEAIKEMNESYLKDELKRIHQEKLINPLTIAKVIDEAIRKNESGVIIRIDGDIDV